MLHKQSGFPVAWRWVAILALAMMALPQAGRAQDTEATWKTRGPFGYVYTRNHPLPPGYGYVQAGLSVVEVDDVLYGAYCLDLYTGINAEDALLIDGLLPVVEQDGVDWPSVHYIIHKYGNTTDPIEAAAVQSAIWYFTSPPFMHDVAGAAPYDGYSRTVTGNNDPVPNRAVIRNRALAIIGSIPADFQIPAQLGLVASDDKVFFKMGETPSTLLVALVLDQNSNPVQGVQVTFLADFGDLSATSVLTNELGEATVELTNTEGTEAQSNVCAWVEGQYAIYLNGTAYNPIRQDMAMFPLLPDTVQDCVTVDWTKKESCCDDKQKLKSLTMQYTAEGKAASSHSQDPSKVVINDYVTPPLPDKVRIIAVDKDTPFHYQAHEFFDGIVELGDEIKIEALTGGQTRFSADMRIFILDPVTCKILQSLKFHVSCSQPLMTGDQFGSMLVTECEGTTVQPPRPKPDSKKKCEDFFKTCRKYFDYKCDKDWKYKSYKNVYNSCKNVVDKFKKSSKSYKGSHHR